MHFNCFGLLDMCKGNDHLGQKEAEGIYIQTIPWIHIIDDFRVS